MNDKGMRRRAAPQAIATRCRSKPTLFGKAASDVAVYLHARPLRSGCHEPVLRVGSRGTTSTAILTSRSRTHEQRSRGHRGADRFPLRRRAKAPHRSPARFANLPTVKPRSDTLVPFPERLHRLLPPFPRGDSGGFFDRQRSSPGGYECRETNETPH